MGTSAADHPYATSIARDRPPRGRTARCPNGLPRPTGSVGRGSGDGHFNERAMFRAPEQRREEFQHRHLPAVLAFQRLLRLLDERSIIDASPVSLRPFTAHLAARVTVGQPDSIVGLKPFHLD